MIAPTRVLIVSPEVPFLTRITPALEQLGRFTVMPFATPQRALDHLKENPHDVALVDYNIINIGIEPDSFIGQLQAIQPEIAILVGGSSLDARRVVTDLGLQGIVELPTTTRTLVPKLDEAIQQKRSKTSPNFSAASATKVEQTKRKTATVKRLVDVFQSDDDEASQTLEFRFEEVPNDELELPFDDKTQKQSEWKTFEQLASEEPPLPNLETTGTVSDLMNRLSETPPEKLPDVLQQTAPSEPVKPERPATNPEDEDENIAITILNTTTDDTSSFGAFSLQEFIANMKKQAPDIKPLPSWVEEVQKFVDEPDFLSEEFGVLNPTSQYAEQTTQASQYQTIDSDTQGLETEVMEPKVRSRPIQPEDLPEQTPTNKHKAPPPPDSLPEVESIQEPQSEDTANFATIEATEHQQDFEQLKQKITQDIQVEEYLNRNFDETPTPDVPPIDSEIAKLALQLTQVSLNLTADATILAKNGDIVTAAGNLQPEDLAELTHAIGNDWGTEGQQVRIRFVTLPSSGDYMVYSCRAIGEFSLSIIFAGTMPLHVIHRQRDLILEALRATMEIPQVNVDGVFSTLDDEAEIELDPNLDRSPFTYVWLLRDENSSISTHVGTAIERRLQQELRMEQWDIQQLRVDEDYIYMQADVPGEESPSELIQDLMRRSGAIASTTNFRLKADTLWADSYLVLTPGREMSIEEIQRFIQFART